MHWSKLHKNDPQFRNLPLRWFAGPAVAICIALILEIPLLAGLAKGAEKPERLDVDELRLFGHQENVLLIESGLILRAKLDTGADSSSVDAKDQELFKKGKGDWVRFRIEDAQGAEAVFEKPVERFVRIKEREGDNRRRPVVRLEICIGDKRYEAMVNLADRSDFSTQMLVGRSVLQHGILINAGAEMTREPVCKTD